MTIALNVEQVVAGYVNTHKDGHCFNAGDISKYISTLWDAGCGPVRLNFSEKELEYFLERCIGVCMDKTPTGFKVNKTMLNGNIESMPEDEQEFFHHDTNVAKSFDLFVKLGVDFRTPDRMLDAMGFRFIYA